MHNISPLDVFGKDSQQSKRNRMAKLLVAIMYTQSVHLHVLIIPNLERVAWTVCVSCQHSYAAAKLRQPAA